MRVRLTLEGLADEGEGGALVADGGGVHERLDGARGAPGRVPRSTRRSTAAASRRAKNAAAPPRPARHPSPRRLARRRPGAGTWPRFFEAAAAAWWPWRLARLRGRVLRWAGLGSLREVGTLVFV